MSEPPVEPEEASDAPSMGRVDRFLEPFFTDPGLGPIVLVCALSLASFGAALILLAVHSRNFFAMAALAIAFWVTFDIVRGDVGGRGLGYVAKALLGLWVLSALGAGGAFWAGLY